MKVALAVLLITLSNPKTIVFYLALLPTVLSLEQVQFADWLVLALITVLVLFVTLTPYVLLATRARSWANNASSLRLLNRLAATLIGGAGIAILLETMQSVRRNFAS